MNEELLQLVYGKMKTDATFDQFKSDISSNEDLQKLAYSKVKTDADFDTFKSDLFGAQAPAQDTAQVVDPSKKKVPTTESPSPDTTLDSTQKNLSNLPNQIVDEPVAALYDQYKEQSSVTPQEEANINALIEAEKKGDRGFFETATAIVDGYLQTGFATPVFKYHTKDQLMQAREQKNKVDFLQALPPDKVAELHSFAGESISKLDGKNMNILAQNKILGEQGKVLSNRLKAAKESIDSLRAGGEGVPPQALEAFKKDYNELNQISQAYNTNVDIIEANTEDIGDFYEEVNLLKKNYQGLDYYQDVARLTTAEMMGGIGELALTTKDFAESSDFIPDPLYSLPFQQEDVDKFRTEVKRQWEMEKSLMSVTDIEGPESFGKWMAEQVATQLPVITTLVASGGSTVGGNVGLGLLSASAAGQKIGELEDQRKEASELIKESNKKLVDHTLTQEDRDKLNKEIKKATKVLEISEAEVLTTGIVFGGLEFASERVSLGILSKGKRAAASLSRSGREEAKSGVKDYLKEVYRQGRASLGAGFSESGAEFLNQLGQNVVDITYLDKTDVHVFDGTADALASGYGMGVGMRFAPAMVGLGAKAIVPKAVGQNIRSKINEINEVMAAAKEVVGVNLGLTKSLEDRVKNLTKSVRDDFQRAFDNMEGRDPVQIQELINLDKKANKIMEQVQFTDRSDIDPKVKQSLLKDFKNEIEKINNKKDEILNSKKVIDDGSENQEGSEEFVSGADKTAEGRTEVQTEDGTEPGEPADVRGPEQIIEDYQAAKPGDLPRTFRIPNIFKPGKPLLEVEVGESVDTMIDELNQKFVNRFFLVNKLQKSLENQQGKQLPQSQNFKQAEVLFHGKAADKLQEFDKQTREVATDIRDSNVNVQQVSDYLMARHAYERNAHIQKIELQDETVASTDRGAGITDAQATDILKSFSESQTKQLEQVAEKIDGILQETRDILLEGGLITEEEHEVFGNYYQYYVPLKGFEDVDIADEIGSAFSLSMSVKGKETKRAAGRRTKAGNVFSNVIAMRNEAIVRAEKNKVMQKLLEQAKQNPDSDTWEIFSKDNTDKIWTIKPNGKAGWQPVNMQGNDKYVGVKVDGEQFYIKFANERLSKILNAASIEKTGVAIRLIGSMNRYLSGVFTMYNPEFVISNFARDIQTALINQASERDIAGNSLAGKSFVKSTMASTLPAIKEIWKAERGKVSNSEISKYYKEFKEDGAKTEWFHAKSVEDIKRNIEKITEYTEGSIPELEAFKAIKDVIDHANTAVENGVRLASYMQARKAGVDRLDAAEFAKELTINFNQKGELGTLANTFYLFFNASVQGTVRFAKAMTTLEKVVDDEGNTKYGLNRGQKMAAGIAIGSAINTMVNIVFSDEDEDGKSFYEKIPDYEKERNMIIMNPLSDEGDYFKIPLPYGYNVFHNIGTISAEVASGQRSVGDGVGFMASAMLNSFSPINFGDATTVERAAMKTALPTIMKPIYDLAINENAFAQSIYGENFPIGTQKPLSHLARPSTNKNLVQITQWMNEVTGGSGQVPGGIDINADKVEYIFEFFGGGTLKFANNLIKSTGIAIDKAQGKDEEFNVRNMPFLRRVYGESSEFVSRQAYYDRSVDIMQLFAEKVATGDHDNPKYKGISRLIKIKKSYDSRLRSLRKAADRIKANETDPIKLATKVKENQKKQDAIYTKFNKTYNELRDD